MRKRKRKTMFERTNAKKDFLDDDSMTPPKPISIFTSTDKSFSHFAGEDVNMKKTGGGLGMGFMAQKRRRR